MSGTTHSGCSKEDLAGGGWLLRQRGVSKLRAVGAPTMCLPVEPGLVGVGWMVGFVGALSLPLDGMSLCSYCNLGQYCHHCVQRTPCLFCSRVSQHEALKPPVIQLCWWFIKNMDS